MIESCHNLDRALQAAVKSLHHGPQTGLFYVNEHVMELDAKTHMIKDELARQTRHINASIKDIEQTVLETRELGSLSGKWATEMLFELNLLLTNLNNINAPCAADDQQSGEQEVELTAAGSPPRPHLQHEAHPGPASGQRVPPPHHAAEAATDPRR